MMLRRIPVQQQRLLQLLLAQVLRRVDRRACEGVGACVIHGGRHRHRRRDEVLHLSRSHPSLLEVERQLDHVGQRAARVPRDVVRHQVLLLAGLLARARELLGEALVAGHPGLLHLVEHVVDHVLRRHRQLPARVVPRQLLDERRRALREVVADPRRDEHPLDPLLLAHALEQVDERPMIRLQVLAHPRVHAGQAPTRGLDRLALAAHLIHVRRRSADVADHPAKVVHAAQRPHLAQHALRRSALDDPPLVLRDRAEAAAAEAAAHRHDRVLDRLERRDLALAVAEVGPAHERQVVERVHVRRLERPRRRVQVHRPLPVRLQQRASVARVRLVLERPRHLEERRLVVLHLLVARQPQRLPVAHIPALLELLPVARVSHVGRAADVAERRDRLARLQARRDLHQRPLAHPEHQQVRLAVEQHAAPHLVAPVVVVGDPSQARLDPAEHHRHPRKRLAHQVAVDHRGPVRPAVDRAVGRVLILAAHLLLRRQLVQHRVEVARRDAHEQPRPPEPQQVLRAVPARLRDHPDPQPPALQEAPDQRPAERRVIDVRVAVDDQHVELVPAARVHLLARHRQERV